LTALLSPPELAVEVTPAERGVVVIGNPEAGGRDAVAKRRYAEVDLETKAK
jgi:hypothetical protein